MDSMPDAGKGKIGKYGEEPRKEVNINDFLSAHERIIPFNSCTNLSKFLNCRRLKPTAIKEYDILGFSPIIP
jgi:hypothetical protein